MAKHKARKPTRSRSNINRDSISAALTKANSLLQTQDAFQAAKLIDEPTNIPQGIINNFHSVLDLAPTQHPLLSALIFLIVFELSSDPEYLSMAKTRLSEMNIRTAESLTIVNSVITLLDENCHREARDLIIANMSKLPVARGTLYYTKDAFLSLFWRSIKDGDVNDITKEDVEFVLDFVTAGRQGRRRSQEQHDVHEQQQQQKEEGSEEHLYHQAIALNISYLLSVKLGNPVPNRLYSSFRKFKALSSSATTDLKSLVWYHQIIATIETTLNGFQDVEGGMMKLKDKIHQQNQPYYRRDGGGDGNGSRHHIYQRDLKLAEHLMNGHWCENVACRKLRLDMELAAFNDGDAAAAITKTTFKKCSRCKRARYCSKACQRIGWIAGRHREFCRPFGEFRIGDVEFGRGSRLLNGKQCILESFESEPGFSELEGLWTVSFYENTGMKVLISPKNLFVCMTREEDKSLAG
ncbi:hypothetical protein BDR26DRAFT_854320 [Obelidium mucronatum]|nr:hypothetical protein BDR26DRAFT_854320 [Obelidium mucronatum]